MNLDERLQKLQKRKQEAVKSVSALEQERDKLNQRIGNLVKLLIELDAQINLINELMIQEGENKCTGN